MSKKYRIRNYHVLLLDQGIMQVGHVFNNAEDVEGAQNNDAISSTSALFNRVRVHVYHNYATLTDLEALAIIGEASAAVLSHLSNDIPIYCEFTDEEFSE